MDVATGAFLIREPVATIPGRVPLSVSWQFQSQDGSEGPLGKGTSLSTDYFLAPYQGGIGWELGAPGNLHFVFNQQTVPPPPIPEYYNATDPEELGAKLTVNPDQTKTLRWKHGQRFYFNSANMLVKIEDRHGNYATIGRNAPVPGFPSYLRQGNNREITFQYFSGQQPPFDAKNGKLWKVIVPGKGTWEFNYQIVFPPMGSYYAQVASVKDPAGFPETFTWDQYDRTGLWLPRCTQVLDREGKSRVINGYYAGTCKIWQQTYADGGHLFASYPDANHTVVTDPNGNVTTWELHWNPGSLGYNIDKVTDEMGDTTEYVRGGSTYLVTRVIDTRVSDGRVLTTDLGWDGSGNLTSLTAPTVDPGRTLTWSAAYNSLWNIPTTITEPPGQVGQPSRVTTVQVDNGNGNVTGITDARSFTTTFGYSASGNGDLTTITNALAKQTLFDYYVNDANHYGDLRRVTDPQLNVTEFLYDTASRVNTVRDPNWVSGDSVYSTDLVYNHMDLVTSWKQYVKDPNYVTITLETLLTYDKNGSRRFLTNPKGKTWEWRYWDSGRLKEEYNPLGQFASYEWDPNGNLTRWIDRNGQQGVYTYDPGPGDRPWSITFKRADLTTESTVNFVYNASTELLERIDDTLSASISFAYDSLDRLKQEGPVSWTLDDLGRRTSLSVPGQGLVTYPVYDATDNLKEVWQNGVKASFEYDALGRMTKRTLPNGVYTDWVFTDAGFLKSVISKKSSGAVIDSFSVYTNGHDKVGNIKSASQNGSYRMFTYDELYRLKSAAVYPTYSYVYDNTGNRTNRTQSDISLNNRFYQYDDANRLIQEVSSGGPAWAMFYDPNGNLISRNGTGGVKTYTWDVRGRLTSVINNGISQGTYSYDTFGRRKSKVTAAGTTTYTYDGDDVVTEAAPGGAFQTLHGPVIDQPLARSTEYFTPNHVGSTTTLTNGAGTPTVNYTYKEPFGEFTVTGSSSNPFVFTGREYDAETDLYYYRARYYSGGWGRFLSEDPIGFAGGLNQYAYVDSNPVNWTDPLGYGKAKIVLRLIELITRDESRSRETVRFLRGVGEAQDARRKGANVLVTAEKLRDARRTAKQIEDGVPGRSIPHRAHNDPDLIKPLPHYQTDGFNGHTFYQAVKSAKAVPVVIPFSDLGDRAGGGIVGGAIDFFNPLSDVQSLIDLINDFSAWLHPGGCRH